MRPSGAFWVQSRRAEILWVITNVTRRFRFAARHFIACARRFSAASFHEFVKGLEIRARFAVGKRSPNSERYGLSRT
jgi:hypothetical protein